MTENCTSCGEHNNQTQCKHCYDKNNETFLVKGTEQKERVVKQFGQHSGYVNVPKSWIGHKVALIKID